MSLYDSVAQKFENGLMRSAAEELIEYIQTANKYYDSQQPWLQVKEEDKTPFYNTTETCLYIIANMSNLFNPIIPFGCAKIRSMLGISEESSWKERTVDEITLTSVEKMYEFLE